jgi:hypothetical protein
VRINASVEKPLSLVLRTDPFHFVVIVTAQRHGPFVGRAQPGPALASSALEVMWI